MSSVTHSSLPNEGSGGLGSPELPRLAHIMRAFIEAGWAHYVQRLHLRRNVSGIASQAGHTSDDDAKQFRETLERLGPAFVKFGQLLCLRRDMLPEIYIEELQKLQDDVAPFSGAQARAIVERELGRPVHELFLEFDDSPLAAASIGQVHAARLFDGTSVVVKVQRPGIEPIIQADLNVLRFLARRLERYVPESRRFGPLDLVEEFAQIITEELDYRTEGRNGDHLREDLQDDPGVFVPRIYCDFTSPRVLTMERSLGAQDG